MKCDVTGIRNVRLKLRNKSIEMFIFWLFLFCIITNLVNNGSLQTKIENGEIYCDYFFFRTCFSGELTIGMIASNTLMAPFSRLNLILCIIKAFLGFLTTKYMHFFVIYDVLLKI